MSLAAKIKRYTPKTPKQWMLLVVGGGGAALLANYVYAGDRSVLSKFWRGVQGKPSPVPPPGSVRAPTHAHASGMGLPSSAVYVEPTHVGNAPIPPEVYAPMYGGVPYFARYFPAPNTESNHQTSGSPKAWDGIRSKVPPPGAYGVASVTPPAPTDPGAPQPAPCGPGLTFDPATGSCVPFPMTPPYGGM
jgi:hypothetical protein